MKAISTFHYVAPDYKGRMAVDITLPSNPQVVWYVGRQTAQPNVNRAVMLAALRQKYGKETIAFNSQTSKPTTNDSAITQMWWIMDEQGHLMSGTPPIASNTNTPYGCPAPEGTDGGPHSDVVGLPDYCTKSFVTVFAEFDAGKSSPRP